MSGKLLDREILDAVEAIETRALDSQTRRLAWRTQDVLRGGPNGRWNPKAFTALYTSLSKDGAIAEVYSLLSKQPVDSSADKLVYRLKVKTQRTLILDDRKALANVGVNLFRDSERNKVQCQLVGEAAYKLDCDSLLVPSVRWDCQNLVLFQDLLDPNDVQVIGKPAAINWPAWGEKKSRTSREFTRRKRSEDA